MKHQVMPSQTVSQHRQITRQTAQPIAHKPVRWDWPVKRDDRVALQWPCPISMVTNSDRWQCQLEMKGSREQQHLMALRVRDKVKGQPPQTVQNNTNCHFSKFIQTYILCNPKIRVSCYDISALFSLILCIVSGASGAAGVIQVGSLQSLPLAMETVTSQLSSLQQNVQAMLQQLNTLALAVHSLSQFYRQVCVCVCVWVNEREREREREREYCACSYSLVCLYNIIASGWGRSKVSCTPNPPGKTSTHGTSKKITQELCHKYDITPPPLKIDDFQGPQLVVRTGRLLTLLLKVGPVVILWPLLVNVVMSILAKR